MTTLREFMTSRRAEIQSQIKALKAELQDIDAAFAALPQDGQSRPQRDRGSSGTGKKTLKELALEALGENPSGLEALEIIKWIKEKYGTEIARESMSPQLSRLGQEEVVQRTGLTWRLTRLSPGLYTSENGALANSDPEDKKAPSADTEEAF
jgi:hypothetical protein